MFSLSDLLNYDGIAIQCHNIPDADTIASAFAVYTYLKAHEKEAKIIYSGNIEITKPNILEMIVQLSIPLEYVKETEMRHSKIETLVLVDCQYGERNAAQFAADTVIVIDHHIEIKNDFSDSVLGVIRSQLGSCSTLVWDLLIKEQFNLKEYPDVSTALYYGLYTDTNNLEEIAHPLDKDMRDSLKFENDIIKRLRNNNLTLSELNIAGMALTRHKPNHDLCYATFHAEPCDPNILGFISDLALQVSGIDVCVVYNNLSDGFKISVRSCTREVMANEFAQFLAEGVGSGGGHISKAGGFISKQAIENLEMNIDDYIEKRAYEYFNSYDVVNAANHNLDITCMKRYKKKKIPVGYVLSTDIFHEGVQMIIRTLEGDTEAEASSGIYLMIGILGEVYPIKAEKFNKSYVYCPDSIHNINDVDNADDIYTIEKFETDFVYSPTVKNKLTGDSAGIMKFAKLCMPVGEVHINAMPVARNIKVFTSWNTEGYMYGKAGDFIAVRADDLNDVYIIRKDIFEKTYMLAESGEE
jgi:phosphoglycolate phosphatase